MQYRQLNADEAAALIDNGSKIGFSGFTPAGVPKAIPAALAKRAEAEHAAGRPFKIAAFTGASTGDSLDGALTRAEAMSWRTPYQAHKDLRKAINTEKISYADMHLSVVQQMVRYGFFGEMDWAIIEATEVTPDGKIYLTTAGGAAATYCRVAKHLLIEINAYHPKSTQGLHDIYQPADPPHRQPIPLTKCSDRIGTPYVQVDPAKIVGVVETNLPDEVGGFDPADETTMKIGENVAGFLANEIREGRVPAEGLPLQSGVGNIANAVLAALGSNKDIPPFEMYSEVMQDSVIELIRKGRCTLGSCTSLTLSRDVLAEVYKDLDFFKKHIIIRPQEISNNPEIVRRLGIISVNTAIEADIFGNVNSTHMFGTTLMNGIGGSGDFTRNAYISIFTCPSIAKDGKISTIVPLVAHMDHSEHSVQIIVTEQGVADLRGKDPYERAKEIIEKCAHPSYREELTTYVEAMKGKGHVPQTLSAAFGMHEHFRKTGDMRGIDWKEYGL